ncbi:hypothetical protein L484_012333 [Morus notabilis]|uniref:Uncharacterized protein n=1 Tax=Morus notabilis TaxID=981085 RepID=W9RVA8_9ROSA|nr:hypothetical protein L484_012333 [Morus notabilis]
MKKVEKPANTNINLAKTQPSDNANQPSTKGFTAMMPRTPSLGLVERLTKHRYWTSALRGMKAKNLSSEREEERGEEGS